MHYALSASLPVCRCPIPSAGYRLVLRRRSSMSKAGTIAKVAGGAMTAVIVWVATWTVTVFVDAALFDVLTRSFPELDYGGQEGFTLMFFALWAGGLVLGGVAFGVVGSVGAGRSWRM